MTTTNECPICANTGTTFGKPCDHKANTNCRAAGGQCACADDEVASCPRQHDVYVQGSPAPQAADNGTRDADSYQQLRGGVEADLARIRKAASLTLGSVPQADALVARVRALAERWNKEAIADGFAGSEPANELFDLFDTAPQEQAERAAVPEHLREFVEAVAHAYDVYDESDQERYCRGCSALIIEATQHQPDCIVPRAQAMLAATPVAQEGKAVDAKREPLNGIPATMRHDEGAVAQCSNCGRYSLDPSTLSRRRPLCECGSNFGWSGSFKRPGPDALWSRKALAAQQDSAQVDAKGGAA